MDDVTLHSVDLTDTAALQDTVAQIAPEWVFHLAVYGAYPTQTVLQTMVQTNIAGTLNLVEAAVRAGAEVIVNTGSSSEYGFKAVAPGESDCAEPNSAYAVTKLSATLLCRELARRSGVRIPTLRLYSVYGPYEEPVLTNASTPTRRQASTTFAVPRTFVAIIRRQSTCEGYAP